MSVNVENEYQAIRSSVYGRIEAALRAERKIVYIYQMGKVASTAYERTLEADNGLEVFHAHRMMPETNKRFIGKFEEANELGALRRELRYLVMGEALRELKFDVFVCSGVRDPIARNASAYFQNLPLPKIKERSIDDLINTFKRTYPHEPPLRWFVEEWRQVLGFDIGEEQFDRERGVGIFTHGNANCLILTAESEDDVKENAMARWLSRDKVDLESANLSRDKEYAKEYSEFLRKLSFDKEFLDRVYSSKYMRQFYTDEAAVKFRNRWAESQHK